MSPAPKEQVDKVRSLVREILGDSASDLFLQRIDTTLNDWAMDKFTAEEACAKIQKNVSLFIDEKKALEIALQCAPIVKAASATEQP